MTRALAEKRQRERRPWKKGNPSANRGAAEYRIDSEARLNFLVVKANGGAPLLASELTELEPSDLVFLGRHLEWLINQGTPGTAGHDNALASLEFVKQQLPDAPSTTSSSSSSSSSSSFGMNAAVWKYAMSSMNLGQPSPLNLLGANHDHRVSDKTWTEADLRPEKHEATPAGLGPTAAGQDRTPPPTVAGRRNLSDWERTAAARYFPPWLDLTGIKILSSLNRGRAWFRDRVAIPYRKFDGKHFRKDSITDSASSLYYLLHEIFHVLQRSLGRPIEREFFGNRPRDRRKKYYSYDHGIGADQVLDHFLRVNFESQAEMFSVTAAKAEGGLSVGNFQGVLDYIRNLPPDATVDALMHPDIPARARDFVPDPRTPDIP